MSASPTCRRAATSSSISPSSSMPPACRRVRGVPFDPLRQQRFRMRPTRPNRKVPRYLRPSLRFGSRSPPRELKDGWTAISTPPYFSALAIWPSFGRWTGGGTFRADRDILLWESEDGITPIENVPIRVLRSRAGFAEVFRASPVGLCAHAHRKPRASRPLTEALLAAGLKWVDWISLRDDLLFAGDGRVFRLPAGVRCRPPMCCRPPRPWPISATPPSSRLRAPASAMQW